MTFKEISAWIEAAAILLLYAYYAAHAPQAISSGAAIQLYAIVAVTFVAVVVGFNIVAAIVHRPEKEDERDKLIAAKSSRNSRFALLTGIVTANVVLLLPPVAITQSMFMPPATVAVHILVLTVAAGEFLRFASQIVYYRRGA